MSTEKEYNIQIDEIWIGQHEVLRPYGTIKIEWHGSTDFGTFELSLDEKGVPHAYTEYMDYGEDKSFTKAILMALVDKIIIDN